MNIYNVAKNLKYNNKFIEFKLETEKEIFIYKKKKNDSKLPYIFQFVQQFLFHHLQDKMIL